jgi:hypothetical protein
MRVSFLSLSVIVGSLLVTSTAILLSLWFARRRRDSRLRAHGKPALVMPFAPPSEHTRGPIVRDSQPMRRSPITALAVAERVVPTDYEILPGLPDDDPSTVTTGQTNRDGAVAEMIQGHAIRFHRPVDRTLQFLPGYLRIVDGRDAGHEIRFVRLDGPEAPVISFGRSEGPPYRHVQLLEPTVSRVHARMAAVSDGWELTNLSRTNPVVVNDIPLEHEGMVRLVDGDRIEMGAVVFRFHAR